MTPPRPTAHPAIVAPRASCEADYDGVRALAAAVIEQAWRDALRPPLGRGDRPDYAAQRDARDFLLGPRVELWAQPLGLDIDALRERLRREIEAKKAERKARRKAAA